MDNMVYIGFGLIGFGLAFFIYMLLSGKPENDEVEKPGRRPSLDGGIESRPDHLKG
ncbi:MAG: hypothetical protein PVI49_13860 [Desulfobacterales bacterium]